jgi:hypothetical protein
MGARAVPQELGSLAVEFVQCNEASARRESERLDRPADFGAFSG